jgi:adenylate cyclase
VVALPLQPLSREANRELVAQLSGLDAEMAFPIADRLYLETAGNPFFLHEIVRGLIETGHVGVEGGRWSGRLVQTALEAEIRLPDSLRETIMARVEHLPEMTRRFIRAAAVAGRMFRYELVQRAGGWTDEQALEALEELLARGFVRESAIEGELTFAYHLMQEAVYHLAGWPAARKVPRYPADSGGSAGPLPRRAIAGDL